MLTKHFVIFFGELFVYKSSEVDILALLRSLEFYVFQLLNCRPFRSLDLLSVNGNEEEIHIIGTDELLCYRVLGWLILDVLLKHRQQSDRMIVTLVDFIFECEVDRLGQIEMKMTAAQYHSVNLEFVSIILNYSWIVYSILKEYSRPV